jgi:tRNA threonylcarbamoyl adenosine modification protein YeaZ
MSENRDTVLLIDTSVNALLALFDGQGNCMGWERKENKRAEDMDTMLQINLEKHSLKHTDIKTIIVANGPGSFTGLRAGIAFAQGLGFPGNMPLHVFSSLTPMLLYLEQSPGGGIIQARRGYYYFSCNISNLPGFASETLISTQELVKLAPLLPQLLISGHSRDESVLEKEFRNIVPLEKVYPFAALYSEVTNTKPVLPGKIKINYIQPSAAEAGRLDRKNK